MPRFIPKLITVAVAATLGAGAAHADANSMLRSLMGGSPNRVTVTRTLTAPARVMPAHVDRFAMPSMRGDAQGMVERMMDRMRPRSRPNFLAPRALGHGFLPPNSLAPYWTPPRLVMPYRSIVPLERFDPCDDPRAYTGFGGSWMGYHGAARCLPEYSGEINLRLGTSMNHPLRTYSGPGWVLMYDTNYSGSLEVRIVAD